MIHDDYSALGFTLFAKTNTYMQSWEMFFDNYRSDFGQEEAITEVDADEELIRVSPSSLSFDSTVCFFLDGTTIEIIENILFISFVYYNNQQWETFFDNLNDGPEEGNIIPEDSGDDTLIKVRFCNNMLLHFSQLDNYYLILSAC